jgi:hypothetical protein
MRRGLSIEFGYPAAVSYASLTDNLGNFTQRRVFLVAEPKISYFEIA